MMELDLFADGEHPVIQFALKGNSQQSLRVGFDLEPFLFATRIPPGCPIILTFSH